MPGPRRIGVYGGTFDPVHRGHLAAAGAARDALDLDLVLFVPAGDPYHRDPPEASGADRLAMLEAAIADEPRFAVSAVDVERVGPTYTIDTLRDVHARHPDAELVLLLGSDALSALPGWREPGAILELASVCAFAHPGDALVPPTLALPGLADRIVLLPVDPLPVTATAVRASVAAGAPLDGLVSPPVAAYIAEHRLYGAR